MRNHASEYAAILRVQGIEPLFYIVGMVLIMSEDNSFSQFIAVFHTITLGHKLTENMVYGLLIKGNR